MNESYCGSMELDVDNMENSDAQTLQDIQVYLDQFNKGLSVITSGTDNNFPTGVGLFSGSSNMVLPKIKKTNGLVFSCVNNFPHLGTVAALEEKDFIKVQQQLSSSTDDATLVVSEHSSTSPASDVVCMGGLSIGGGDGGDQCESHIFAVNSSEGKDFHTLTLMPSEVGSDGEVSYMLIVSQGEDQESVLSIGRENVDLSTYDFEERNKSHNDVGNLFDEERNGDLENDDEDDYEAMEGEGVHSVGMSLSKRNHLDSFLQGSIVCNYCNYSSPKRYLLLRHMKTHSEERPHRCTVCNGGFKTIASLQNHANAHAGIKPHKCKECDSAFTTSGELVRHVRYRHTFEKPHRCTECDYASVELSKLKRHIRSHTGERPYQCPHCSYASPDTCKLKRHLRIHTGEKPYECDVCHARFTQSNSRKAHMLIHTGNKPVFQCELCPTSCSRKTDLKTHMQKLHTCSDVVGCKKCGKSFPDRYTYKVHLKTHESEKSFACELCPYTAFKQRHLETHIMIHTGEKVFECQHCQQAFKQKQLLKRHLLVSHTPGSVQTKPLEMVHTCDICGKSFAHSGNMMKHMLKHDPNNPEYQCYQEIKNENGHVFNEEVEEEEESNEFMNDEDFNEREDIEGAVMNYIQNGNGGIINADHGPILVRLLTESGERPTLFLEHLNADENDQIKNSANLLMESCQVPIKMESCVTRMHDSVGEVVFVYEDYLDAEEITVEEVAA